MKLKNIFFLFVITVVLAACNLGESEYNGSSSTVNGSHVEQQALQADYHHQIDNHINHAGDLNTPDYQHTFDDLAIFPNIYGVDIDKDTAVAAGIMSSILFMFSSTAVPAGIMAIIGVIVGLFDPQAADAVNTLFDEIHQLQVQVQQLNEKVYRDENIFYAQVTNMNEKFLGQYANQFYQNGYNYLALNTQDSLIGGFVAAFRETDRTANINMSNLDNKMMLAIIDKPQNMKIVVANYPRKSIDQYLTNITASYIDNNESNCINGGTLKSSCYKSVKQVSKSIGTHNSSILTLFDQFVTTESNLILHPKSHVNDISMQYNVTKIFDSANDYISLFMLQAGAALQNAYSVMFVSNWLNYQFGLKHYKEFINNKSEFAVYYQIPAIDKSTEFNTHFEYDVTKSESENKANYLKAQYNLQNTIYMRANALIKTAYQHIVSDHLYTSKNSYYESHSVVYQDKTKKLFDGNKVVYNEGKLVDNTLEATKLLAAKMSLPIYNKYNHNDESKPWVGYFYVYKGLRSASTCYSNSLKESFTKDNFDKLCPSVYAKNSTLMKESNIYDGNQFSTFVIIPESPYNIKKTMVYPKIGYRCDLNNPNNAKLFTVYKASNGEIGFSCPANMDRGVLQEGINNSPNVTDSDVNIHHNEGISKFSVYYYPYRQHKDNEYKNPGLKSEDIALPIYPSGREPSSSNFYVSDGDSIFTNSAYFHHDHDSVSYYVVATAHNMNSNPVKPLRGNSYNTDLNYYRGPNFLHVRITHSTGKWHNYFYIGCLSYDPWCSLVDGSTLKIVDQKCVISEQNPHNYDEHVYLTCS